MSNDQPSTKTFRIGIAMAGAVSAGAYTAGVIDYLLQTLDAWEKKKQKNRNIETQFGSKDLSKGYDPSIPMHDVKIEVIGGASAGGITAALTVINLLEGFKPASENHPNLLYDCWVNLNDNSDASTLEQMLSKTDLQQGAAHIYSLLNSEPIGDIARKALHAPLLPHLPPYVSEQLEVLLTLTSLRGIPIAVNFYDKVKVEGQKRKEAPAHQMNLHRAIAHYRLGDPSSLPPHVFPFRHDVREDREMLIKFAIASGAFPLGLKPQFIEKTPLSYIQAMTNRMFKTDSSKQAFFDVLAHSDPFEYVAVDGGTINNEPFGEIIDVLKEKCKEEHEHYAVIMIDPFPNFQEEETIPEFDYLPSLAQQVPGILGAIRGQAMMKETEIARGFSGDYTRRMIFPKRDDDPFPISCGALEGFGGFFNKDFRIHDFELGRKNCQSFLRKYLTVRLKDLDQVGIFEDWKPDDAKHQRFFIPDKYGKEGYYPIIPDVRATENPLSDPTKLSIPDRKTITTQEIFALRPSVKDRIQTMLIMGLELLSNKKPGEEPIPELEWAEKQMTTQYGKNPVLTFVSSLFFKIFAWLWRLFLAKLVAKQLSGMVIKQILYDFRRRGLVK